MIVEVGGGLRSYSVDGVELVDGYPADGMATSARGQVLVPWPNRIEDGSYEFEGRRLQLPLTEPEAHNAIHGLVRWAAWSVRTHEPDRAVVEHVLRPQPGYPFTLSLGIEYTVSADGLTVRTTATNLGDEACPFGCGAHPYLTVGTPRIDPLALRLPARTVILSDGRGLPVERAAVEGTDYDFREARPLGATVLNNAYTDLERGDDGLARIELRDPEAGNGLALWLDESYPYAQLFTGDPLPDVARRSLAVEPMSCPANGFRTGEGLIRLEPGETFKGAWGIGLL